MHFLKESKKIRQRNNNWLFIDNRRFGEAVANIMNVIAIANVPAWNHMPICLMSSGAPVDEDLLTGFVPPSSVEKSDSVFHATRQYVFSRTFTLPLPCRTSL